MRNANDTDIAIALDAAISAVGVERVTEALRELAGPQDGDADCLTIVANSGVHFLAAKHLRGEVYVASKGNLDLSTPEATLREFKAVLSGVAQKLRSRAWRRVYIVPFGPAPLSMQIKLLVFRVCGIESIDSMSASGQERFEISLDLRQLIIDSGG